MIRLLVSTFALLATLVGGIWLGAHPAYLPDQVRSLLVDDPARLSQEAASLIESNYYREVSNDQLSNGSVAGMVRSVSRAHDDRFSHYFDPNAMEEFNQAISGSFSGVGLSVVEVPRGLRVGRVFSSTPAEESGISVGEVIVSVDGDEIAGIQAEAVTRRIKGPEGTSVELGVLNPATNDVREVELVRREISVPPTRTSIREIQGMKLGYLEFATFSRGAHQYVRNAYERLQKMGAEGVLLDLRANGGGLLSEAVLTTSLFIPEGEVVVSTRSRSDGDRVYESVGGQLPELPMVILINRDTASAAEILASALNYHRDAPLVGGETYGKGVFQKIINLSNGGALDLTVGEYLTAEGASLANDGIDPEIEIQDRPETDFDDPFRRGLKTLAREVSQGGT